MTEKKRMCLKLGNDELNVNVFTYPLCGVVPLLTLIARGLKSLALSWEIWTP